MKKLKLDSTFTEYECWEELPPEDQDLLQEARVASAGAYAPYSRFFVGAAVLLENGIIIRGNNQENAAYPSGLCAERVALFAAGAQYPGVRIRSIAITAVNTLRSPDKPQGVSPCGDCRQVMAEYEHRYLHSIRLIMEGGNGRFIVSDSARQLLPFLFNSDQIGA